MKKIYALVLTVLLGPAVYAQCVSESVSYGNPPKKSFGQGTAYGNAVAADNSGNIIVAGQYRDSLTLNNGTLVTAGTSGFLHGFILKYDAAGNLLWHETARSTNSSKPIDIVDVITDAGGNIYILGKCHPDFASFDNLPISCSFGQCTNEIFVARYDASGAAQWVFTSKTSTNVNHRPGGLALKNNGNIVLTGTYESSPVFGSTTLSGAGSYKVFLAELDAANGNVVWAKYMFTASSSGSDLGEAASVTVDNADNIYFAGDVQTTNVILGPDTLRYGNFYLAKTDASGNIIWGRGYRTDCGESEAEDIRYANNKLYLVARAGGNCDDNSYFISGSNTFSLTTCGSNAPQATFAVVTDTAGMISNLFCIGAPGFGTSSRFVRPIALEVNAAGHIIVGGVYDVSIYFPADTLVPGTGSVNNTYVAAYDDSGNFLWAKSAVNNNGVSNKQTEARDVGVYADKVLVTGYFSDNSEFGTIPVNVAGDKDYFLWNVCDNAVGIEGNAMADVTVYPNPAQGRLMITTGYRSNLEVKVWNTLGQQVFSSRFNSAGVLDVSNLPAGVYYLSMTVSDQPAAKSLRKIIIHK